MRDFEILRRSLARRTGYYSDKSSLPLISGDTYRALCKIHVDELRDIEKLEKPLNYSGLIFLRAEVAQVAIESIISNFDGDFSKVKFIIHNGDSIPSFDLLIELSQRSEHVYSVNCLTQNPIISALPIGLENWDYLRNGVPADYKSREQFQREIPLLVSFNDSTNPNERNIAREYARSVEGAVFLDRYCTPKKYRDLVKRSKFVLSPPGNGPDCHRTWEAFYLGATPIVKAKFWPFPTSSLPVLVLNDWADLTSELLQKTPNSSISADTLFQMFVKPFTSD